MPAHLCQTTGRRKSAVARVRLREGTGVISVNGRSFEDYFSSVSHRRIVISPFDAVDASARYDVDARLSGGGVSGQVGALVLGIARGLVELDEELRPVLKSQGFLTRDARRKERKKYGLKKARKAPQYSKR